MHRNQKGMSLVEIMVAIAVSAIVIGAAYGSYSVINKNYEFQKDVKYMSQTARAVVKMIARDVRMAGYQDFNATSISEAIKVTDSSNNCCDRIDIIYDKSSSERIKISYYTKQYQNRNRLMKLVMRCTVSDCTKTSTLQSEQPVADYVDDLQFSTLREGAAVRTSSTPTWGTGKIGWFKPTSVKADCADVYPALGNKSGKIEYLTDDDMSTSWTCKIEAPRKANAFGNKNAKVTFTFNPAARILKVKSGTSAHIDGGNANGCYRIGQRNCYVKPFGSKRSVKQHVSAGEWTTVGYVKPANKPLPNQAAVQYGFYNMTGGGGGGMSCSCYSRYQSCYGNPELCNLRDSSSPNTWTHYALISSLTFNFTSPVIIDYPQGINTVDLKDSSFKNTGYIEVPEVLFYGEVWGAPATPDQVEIGLLLRSPNEHQTKSKSFSMNMGNRSFASNDRYMRDSFSTSVIVRNLYYANQ